MRNLDPATTYYIDADRKGLSWRGWSKQYNKENKNYSAESDATKIRSILRNISDKATHIKTVVVDTLNAIMIDDEMRRMREKGYDKWAELAMCVWELVSDAYTYRDDLIVIFVGHSITERDDSGYMWTHLRTSGKKLEKICLEGKFNIVLLAKCANGEYVFETKSNNSTAKSPLGMFDEATIPNDMSLVLSKLEEF
jgi:nitrogen regulatory protein PII-like uncharacterized protein